MSRPRKPLSKRRVGLAVYLEPHILEKLKAAAEADRRSVSTQAMVYLERGLGLRKRDRGES
jgi:hypothetical protein